VAGAVFIKTHYHQPLDDMSLPFNPGCRGVVQSLNLAIARSCRRAGNLAGTRAISSARCTTDMARPELVLRLLIFGLEVIRQPHSRRRSVGVAGPSTQRVRRGQHRFR
jgi:hypothetical protein